MLHVKNQKISSYLQNAQSVGIGDRIIESLTDTIEATSPNMLKYSLLKTRGNR
ncbi:MAG: Unknown protein [uncultured Sulfurovum sp.]|uniref:Uncharacterized protein n=1 Tax=uncultured Sulfurovum sp. TaxID=269237 RepID=A0A6S6TKJ6_9BACT|nr:MAG: Unknown protein [uncultured Sulfurovum sp.]